MLATSGAETVARRMLLSPASPGPSRTCDASELSRLCAAAAIEDFSCCSRIEYEEITLPCVLLAEVTSINLLGELKCRYHVQRVGSAGVFAIIDSTVAVWNSPGVQRNTKTSSKRAKVLPCCRYCCVYRCSCSSSVDLPLLFAGSPTNITLLGAGV